MLGFIHHLVRDSRVYSVELTHGVRLLREGTTPPATSQELGNQTHGS